MWNGECEIELGISMLYSFASSPVFYEWARRIIVAVLECYFIWG